MFAMAQLRVERGLCFLSFSSCFVVWCVFKDAQHSTRVVSQRSPGDPAWLHKYATGTMQIFQRHFHAHGAKEKQEEREKEKKREEQEEQEEREKPRETEETLETNATEENQVKQTQ